MTSTIKVNTVKDTASTDIIKKCGTSITVGTASDTTTVAGNAVRSNAIQASDGQNIISQVGTTITLGASGDTINLASGASQSGFGRTGTVDWQTTPKTATFTAVSGEGYFCNTSGGAFTVNLPAGSAGAIVSLADYAATWQTSNVTVSPNGTDKIGSLNQNAVLSTEGQSVTFVFVDSTQGWINTMDSTSNVRGAPPYIIASVSGACNTLTTVDTNFKLATFTGPGTFTVCSVAVSAADNAVAYMVIAGGGGNGNAGSGGGAGGFREGTTAPIVPYTASPLVNSSGITVTAQAYSVVIGAGGGAGVKGSDTTALGITSTGGGLGGDRPSPGGPGGSGGGASDYAGSATGGAGNTPPVSPPQGNPGGDGSSGENGGGGGGATGVGGCGTGVPGTGATTQITGSAVIYAAGGAGDGASPAPGPATPRANTGGGSSTADPGAGSGIVVIRYRFQ